MSKFNRKYRIKSIRLYGWDYGQDAIYFITICTKNRRHFFGKIVHQQMKLSEIGKIACKYWLEIPTHFPFVILHDYIVMPNHVHGLIEIAKNNISTNDMVGPSNVKTQDFANLRPKESSYKNKFGPQSKNLSSIIRGYKIGVTKNARTIQSDFQWQPGFYDHIVRNSQTFHRISNYIKTNPNTWKTDEFNHYTS